MATETLLPPGSDKEHEQNLTLTDLVVSLPLYSRAFVFSLMDNLTSRALPAQRRILGSSHFETADLARAWEKAGRTVDSDMEKGGFREGRRFCSYCLFEDYFEKPHFFSLVAPIHTRIVFESENGSPDILYLLDDIEIDFATEPNFRQYSINGSRLGRLDTIEVDFKKKRFSPTPYWHIPVDATPLSPDGLWLIRGVEKGLDGYFWKLGIEHRTAESLAAETVSWPKEFRCFAKRDVIAAAHAWGLQTKQSFFNFSHPDFAQILDKWDPSQIWVRKEPDKRILKLRETIIDQVLRQRNRQGIDPFRPVASIRIERNIAHAWYEVFKSLRESVLKALPLREGVTLEEAIDFACNSVWREFWYPALKLQNFNLILFLVQLGFMRSSGGEFKYRSLREALKPMVYEAGLDRLAEEGNPWYRHIGQILRKGEEQELVLSAKEVYILNGGLVDLAASLASDLK
jgi:hypothetical protein